jgi:predicted small secreted protein
MTPTIIIAASTAIALLASGCSTTAGAGKDLQSAGKAITKTAEDAKK